MLNRFDVQSTDFLDIDGFKTDDIHVIASLSCAAKYQDTLQKVDEEVARNGDNLPEVWVGPSEADPVYRLIVACNELAMGIDDDIVTTHSYIKQKYAVHPLGKAFSTQPLERTM